MFKILNSYERINVHARGPLETRRARWNNVISTPNTFALYITWLPDGGAAAVQPALEQQTATMLFLQLYTWISEERHFFLINKGGVSHDTRL